MSGRNVFERRLGTRDGLFRNPAGCCPRRVAMNRAGTNSGVEATLLLSICPEAKEVCETSVPGPCTRVWLPSTYASPNG